MENFEILDKLGEGSFSVVYKVKRKIDNQIYALKRVKLKNLKEKNVLYSLNEVRILASIKSNYIISYKEAFYDEKDNTLILVMEYADNGDLNKMIKRYKKNNQLIEEDEIWKIFIQLIKGLKSLHDLNILHRDIKSANIFLFSNGSAKLGDLNVSKVAKNGLTYTQTGTPYYASPEVWNDLPYDYKSDIWSLGCVLYEMITLNLPFKCNMKDLHKKIMKGEFKKIPKGYSVDLERIVHLLIQVNQDKRPNCKELLNNPIIKNKIEYLKNIDANADYKNEDNTYENSFLLKTIEMPKDLVKTPLRLPKPNYSKSEIEKSFENKSQSQNLFSCQNDYKNNYNNYYNNNNIFPLIKNTRKYLFNKCFEKNNNNNQEKNEINKYLNYNANKHLMNNFNMQWLKFRNNRINCGIVNDNKVNRKSSDSMKIIKLYKPPTNMSNDLFGNNYNKINMKENNINNGRINISSLPRIRKKYNNNIYSQIKIIQNK